MRDGDFTKLITLDFKELRATLHHTFKNYVVSVLKTMIILSSSFLSSTCRRATRLSCGFDPRPATILPPYISHWYSAADYSRNYYKGEQLRWNLICSETDKVLKVSVNHFVNSYCLVSGKRNSLNCSK